MKNFLILAHKEATKIPENKQNNSRYRCLFEPMESLKELKKVYATKEEHWTICLATTPELYSNYDIPEPEPESVPESAPEPEQESSQPKKGKGKKSKGQKDQPADQPADQPVEFNIRPEQIRKQDLVYYPLAYGKKKEVKTLYDTWKKKVELTDPKHEKFMLVNCKQNLLPLWLLFLATAVIVGGALIYYFNHNNTITDTDNPPDGPVIEGDIPNMTEEEILEALRKKQERGQFLLEAEPLVVATAGSKTVKLVVSNSAQNRSDCYIQLKTKEGELLYTSPKLAPRSYIEEAELSRELLPDETKISAVYNIYNEQQFRDKKTGKVYLSADTLIKDKTGSEPEDYTRGVTIDGQVINSLEEYLSHYGLNISDYDLPEPKVKAVYDVDLTVKHV